LEEHEAERGGVNNYLMDDVVAAKLHIKYYFERYTSSESVR
jgi:hypothetical protein